MKNILAVLAVLAFVASSYAQGVCQTRTSTQFRAGSARYIEVPQNLGVGDGSCGASYNGNGVVGRQIVAIEQPVYYSTQTQRRIVAIEQPIYYSTQTQRRLGIVQHGSFYDDGFVGRGRDFRSGRVGAGGGNGGFAANALDALLSPQGILTIGGAAGGAAIAGPLGAPAGAAIGSAIGQVLGAGIQNGGGNTGRRR